MATLTKTDAHEAIDSIISERDHLKTQLAQGQRTMDSLRQERDELRELIKPLEIFKPLLNDPKITHQIWLRDKALITTLKATALKWYGPAVDTNSEDKLVAKNARTVIELIVEECVRYGILTVPHIIQGLLDMSHD